MPLVDLLAVDLDFTLLDGERNVTKDGHEALQRAINAGLKIAFASGRIASSMRWFADQMGIKAPLVSCNGALVVDENDAVLSRHVLKWDVVCPILEFCESKGLHTNFYADGTVYFAFDSEWGETYRRRVRNSESRVVGWDGLRQLEPYKVIIVSDPDTIQAIAAEAENLLDPGLVTVTRSEAEYLEFLNPGCSKATGLADLAHSMGISQSRVAAIGDYYNDVEMLRWAGHSAAVANAPEAVQQAAKVVVAAHDSGGVARYVDLLLENLEQS